MRYGALAVITVASLLGGCTVGPQHVRPDPKAPLAWHAASQIEPKDEARVEITDRQPETPWWNGFSDPVLDRLIEAAVARNLDLKVARARVLEARAARGVATASLFPQVNAGTIGERGNTRIPNQNQTIGLFDAAFDAGWEIDLFGGIRSRVRAANALAEARQDDERATLLSLRAEVARNYLELRDAQNRLQVTRANIASRRDIAELTQALRRAGLRSELDVSQAQSQSLALEPNIPVLQTAIDASQRRIEVLLGYTPGSLADTLAPARPVPVAGAPVHLDEPASVLARRPDVSAAERELAAATALTAAAVSDLYPKVSLAGLLGYRNVTDISGFRIWSLGGAVTLPIFNGGRIRSQIAGAAARQEQALLAFERTVLGALEEVDVGVTSYLNAEATRKALAALVENEQDKLALANERYRRGLTAFIDVLEAQRAVQESQIALARAEGEVGRSYVAVNKALGR
jgi:NodT family efflux transporter outer membrane factor (OMF) lipoprotein